MGNEPCIETEHIHVGICAKAGYKIGYAQALSDIEAVADIWQKDLDGGGIRDTNARYCWDLAVRELRAAIDRACT